MSERDVSDRIAEGGTVRGIMEQAFPPPPPVTNHAKHAVRTWVQRREALERGEVTLGIPSRWPKVTKVLGGGYRPGLHLVGAAEGFGKSTWVEQEVYDMVTRKSTVPCALLSLEMRKDYVIERIVCRECGWAIDYLGEGGGGWSDLEWEKVTRKMGLLCEADLWIEDYDDLPDCSADSVVASLQRLYDSSGGRVQVAVVDHFHRITIALGNQDARHYYDAAASKLEEWAKRHGVALLLPVQLTKEGNDPSNRPLMKHVREASKLAQDCISATILRAADRSTQGWAGRTAVYVKARGGCVDDIPMWWDRTAALFAEHTNSRSFESIPTSRY